MSYEPLGIFAAASMYFNNLRLENPQQAWGPDDDAGQAIDPKDDPNLVLDSGFKNVRISDPEDDDNDPLSRVQQAVRRLLEQVQAFESRKIEDQQAPFRQALEKCKKRLRALQDSTTGKTHEGTRTIAKAYSIIKELEAVEPSKIGIAERLALKESLETCGKQLRDLQNQPSGKTQGKEAESSLSL